MDILDKRLSRYIVADMFPSPSVFFSNFNLQLDQDFYSKRIDALNAPLKLRFIILIPNHVQ